MKKNVLTITSILTLTLLFTGCANYRFIKTGLDQTNFSPREKDCSVSIITSLPTDRKYVEIGICKGTAPGGGMISDRTHKAIEQVKKCACENGGNAVLLSSGNEGGYLTDFGYSQQVVKASGTVYYIYPKEK